MKYKILSILFPLVFANYVTAQVNIFINGFEKIVVPIVKLNDTGITWSGDYPSGNNVSCNNPASNPSPQDCNTGRDADILTNSIADDGHAGFSFTKLHASGVPLTNQSLAYDTTPWACVQDNVTGLVWEVKTKGLDTIANFHRFILTYKWGGDTAIGKGHPNSQGPYYDVGGWNALVQGSNTEILCGFNNWRVPTVAELSSIVNKGTFNPAIDTDYFPQTQSNWYWSSSPVANDSGKAWAVDFINGGDSVTGGLNASRFNDFHVRLVRSGQ